MHDRSCDSGPRAPRRRRAQLRRRPENRAKAKYLARDYRAAINAYERAYTAYRQEGDLLAAARTARTVAWFHGSLYVEWAVYAGWIRRALALLEQAADNAKAHAWVLLARAQAGTDLEQQRHLYLAVVERARTGGDVDLECEALASLGIMLVFSGFVGDGMGYSDEALAAVCSGEVHELSVVERRLLRPVSHL